MEAAMNESSHGEEQSDAAIQLEFQMDCHARRAGLAMTSEQVGDLLLLLILISDPFAPSRDTQCRPAPFTNSSV